MIWKAGKILILILFLISHTIYLAGQTKNYFTISNAQTIQKGKWESGLIQPFRIGISEKIEIYSSILAMPLIPNVGLKKNWIDSGDHLISSMHSLSVPSPFLNISSASGVGGLIPPEFDFPFILSVSNSILISKKVFQEQMLTFRTDFVFAVRGGTINPYIHHRFTGVLSANGTLL